MVDQIQPWKNRSKLLDSFEFVFDLRLKNKDFWQDLYLVEGLSAAQIADRFGVPKSTVRGILLDHGLRKGSSKGSTTQPNNYRAANPPYGYRVVAGKLTIDRKEIEICKLILSLRREQGMNWSAIVRELKHRQIPTRQHDEGACWHRHTVRLIFDRWNPKI